MDSRFFDTGGMLPLLDREYIPLWTRPPRPNLATTPLSKDPDEAIKKREEEEKRAKSFRENHMACAHDRSAVSAVFVAGQHFLSLQGSASSFSTVAP